MATGADVLKEFVVAIGFKVDETSVRKFSQTFKRVATGLAEVAASVVATGLAITSQVNKIAGDFSKMYFTAQRTGTTVKSLQEIQYAAEQAGVSADEVTGQINNLFMALKKNPGLAGQLEGWGVNTQEKDSVKLYMDFIDKMQHLPDVTKAQVGDVFGQDLQTMLQIMKNPAKFRADVAKRAEMNRRAGIDPDEQARKMVEYENSIKDFNVQLKILYGTLAVSLAPKLKWFNEEVLTPMIAKLNTIDPRALTAITALGVFFVILAGVATVVTPVITALGTFVSLLGSLGGLVGIGGGAAAAGGGAAVVGGGTAAAGGAAAAAGGTAVLASIAAVVVPIVIGAIAAFGIAYILKKTGALDAMQKWGEEHSVEKTLDKIFGIKRDSDPKKEEEAAKAAAAARQKKLEGATEWFENTKNKWTEGIDKFRAAVSKADQWAATAGDKMASGIGSFRAGVGKADEWVAKKSSGVMQFGKNILDASASAAEKLIAGFEGWSDKAYADAGKMSIGFGHQIKPGEEGLLNRPISKEEGRALLTQDVGKHEAAIRKMTAGMGLNDEMIGALTSLHYNLGSFAKAGTMTDAIKGGNIDEIGKAFALYNRSEGKENAALTTRRGREAAEWYEGAARMQGQSNGGPQVHQETTINVNGAGDPQRVATVVADEQVRVNQAAARNLKARTA